MAQGLRVALVALLATASFASVEQLTSSKAQSAQLAAAVQRQTLVLGAAQASKARTSPSKENHAKHVQWAQGLNEGRHYSVAHYGLAAKEETKQHEKARKVAQEKKADAQAKRTREKRQAAEADKKEKKASAKIAQKAKIAADAEAAKAAATKAAAAAKAAAVAKAAAAAADHSHPNTENDIANLKSRVKQLEDEHSQVMTKAKQDSKPKKAPTVQTASSGGAKSKQPPPGVYIKKTPDAGDEIGESQASGVRRVDNTHWDTEEVADQSQHEDNDADEDEGEGNDELQTADDKKKYGAVDWDTEDVDDINSVGGDVADEAEEAEDMGTSNDGQDNDQDDVGDADSDEDDVEDTDKDDAADDDEDDVGEDDEDGAGDDEDDSAGAGEDDAPDADEDDNERGVEDNSENASIDDVFDIDNLDEPNEDQDDEDEDDVQ